MRGAIACASSHAPRSDESSRVTVRRQLRPTRRQRRRWAVDDERLHRLGAHRRAELDAPAPGEPPMHELDSPMNDDERRSVLDRAFAELDREAPPRKVGNARRSVAIVGAVMMLAAALVLWVALPRATSDAALPEYAATRLDGGRSEVRSTTS